MHKSAEHRGVGKDVRAVLQGRRLPHRFEHEVHPVAEIAGATNCKQHVSSCIFMVSLEEGGPPVQACRASVDRRMSWQLTLSDGLTGG